jgi:hypothetical protein
MEYLNAMRESYKINEETQTIDCPVNEEDRLGECFQDFN